MTCLVLNKEKRCENYPYLSFNQMKFNNQTFFLGIMIPQVKAPFIHNITQIGVKTNPVNPVFCTDFEWYIIFIQRYCHRYWTGIEWSAESCD